uniref:Uncharacterized protein n=1 Tax=Globodera rostochiensis TaxID=31243 RepID=A0A914I125_GLORO
MQILPALAFTNFQLLLARKGVERKERFGFEPLRARLSQTPQGRHASRQTIEAKTYTTYLLPWGIKTIASRVEAGCQKSPPPLPTFLEGPMWQICRRKGICANKLTLRPRNRSRGVAHCGLTCSKLSDAYIQEINEAKAKNEGKKILEMLERQCDTKTDKPSCEKAQFPHYRLPFVCTWDFVRTNSAGWPGRCCPSTKSQIFLLMPWQN